MAPVEAERRFVELVAAFHPDFDPSQTHAVRWLSAGRSASRSVSYSQSHPAHHRATPARNLLFAMEAEAERESEREPVVESGGVLEGGNAWRAEEVNLVQTGDPQPCAAGRTLQRRPPPPLQAGTRPAAMPTSPARPNYWALRALAFAAQFVLGKHCTVSSLNHRPLRPTPPANLKYPPSRPRNRVLHAALDLDDAGRHC